MQLIVAVVVSTSVKFVNLSQLHREWNQSCLYWFLSNCSNHVHQLRSNSDFAQLWRNVSRNSVRKTYWLKPQVFPNNFASSFLTSSLNNNTVTIISWCFPHAFSFSYSNSHTRTECLEKCSFSPYERILSAAAQPPTLRSILQVASMNPTESSYFFFCLFFLQQCCLVGCDLSKNWIFLGAHSLNNKLHRACYDPV